MRYEEYVKDERCFAEREDGTCNALSRKKCENCPFYKKRSEIKDNPFYVYSWIDKNKMLWMIKHYKINRDDIIR